MSNSVSRMNEMASQSFDVNQATDDSSQTETAQEAPQVETAEANAETGWGQKLIQEFLKDPKANLEAWRENRNHIGDDSITKRSVLFAGEEKNEDGESAEDISSAAKATIEAGASTQANDSSSSYNSKRARIEKELAEMQNGSESKLG